MAGDRQGNGRETVGKRHGNGMVCMHQTRPHCVNQMGKTQSKALAERHGRGTAGEQQGNSRGTAGERHGACESAFKTAWERHDMCESALRMLNEGIVRGVG
jgi:hypothetical protein